jgi:SAM-dependent methyltransferase
MKYSRESFSPAADEFRGRISTSALAEMWRIRWGINAAQFFSTPETKLEPVFPYGYLRFTSVQSGDAAFYSQLMHRMGYENADKAEFTEAAQEINPSDAVLDVGCGTGNFSIRCTGQYRGIDTNPAAVEDARKLGRNVHLRLVQEEPPNTYDVVTIFQVLEHVDDPKAFLNACVNCLRPGGRLIVSVPNMNGFMGYIPNEALNYPPHHMTWWSELSLQALLMDCRCQATRVWIEPLRQAHLPGVLLTLIWPRTSQHFSRPWLFQGAYLASRCLAYIIGRRWDNIPFIAGHTLMVVATKESL